MASKILKIQLPKPPSVQCFLVEKQDENVECLINDHYFNESLDTISTNPIVVPEYFWYECRAPLLYFISSDFIKVLQQNDKRLYIMARSYRIDSESTFAILPNGTFIINCNKDMYETLGITGKKSRITPNRHVIKLDLLDISFEPGNKLYDRVQWCFENTCPFDFSFYASCWSLSSRSSVNIPFPSTVQFDLKNVQFGSRMINDCIVPEFSAIFKEDIPKDFFELESANFLEWIGLVNLQSLRIMSNAESVDPFVCAYDSMEPNSVKSVCSTRIRGFLIPEFISSLEFKGSLIQIISVRGYRHAPVSWKDSEHSCIPSGENDYVIYRNIETPQILAYKIASNLL